jgi:hypothetical protein
MALVTRPVGRAPVSKIVSLHATVPVMSRCVGETTVSYDGHNNLRHLVGGKSVPSGYECWAVYALMVNDSNLPSLVESTAEILLPRV